MKLQVLIPHYKEDASVIKPLLDSIALQQSVDFKDIGVVIGHDGLEAEDFIFTDDLTDKSSHALPNSYPFEIKQVRGEHKGVSATRNLCLDNATADFVMFCDIDDMFLNSCGLYMVFREIATESFDSLASCFVEESRHPITKEIVYINHDMDSTFVHGKIHRRGYLLEKNIRWNDKLTIHEDSYFNILCQNLSQNVKYISYPFYLWKWRDESVCRHDPKYILKTYRNMLDSNDALIEEFLRRNILDKAAFYTVFMTFDAYYTMNKPEWINQKNRSYRNETEKRFAKWFTKYKEIWSKVPDNEKMQVSNGIRQRSVNEGMQMETITIDKWLKKIEKLV